MEENSDLNLSQILFKPQPNYIETSLISNSGAAVPDIALRPYSGSGFHANWYRPLNRYMWSWMGGNPLDIEEALANIACSEEKRSRENMFDTVSLYGPGNWIFEFANIAQKRILKAKKAIEDNKYELASHHYRMASRYFAIAAYPNLKGDVLAAEASLYGRKAYREIFVNSKRCGYYSEEEFTVRGKKVIGYLHSPDNKDLHPCVVMLGAYDQTATDFFRIFNDELRPLGIAAFVVDMPGMGNSGNLVLDENYSEIAENAILHLKEKVSFIDSTKIGLFGLHLSAAAAVRLAVLRSDLVNGLVVLDPTVHNIFTNVNYLSDAPLCLRSSIANRLNADASNWDTLMPQLRILSLKQQGLLSASGKCPVNCCVAVSDGDRPLVDDAHAVADAFRHNDFVDFKEASADLSFARASKLVGKFFKEQFT
ncbi:alpha/beta hydrolase [Succinatimonas hippei]|uniref:alpha/beta hydrolase n=1 Tax=Succinatimonas hippei TaxID=626938 RepID=UPI0026EA2AA2|nr:alpha/beta hydrolase [Succinatimonas hippei]